jgi:hypothetical protein
MKQLVVSFLATSLAMPLVAQCTNPWLPADGLPGTNGTVHASTFWDPDGAGPLPARLVLGGAFTTAGSVSAGGVASWDGATFAPIGSSFLGPGVGTTNGPFVSALLVLPNGDLVAGGSFSIALGGSADFLVRWDGSAWSQFSPGATNGTVRALTLAPNGDLVAVGDFSTIGGVAAVQVARWNGATWSSLSFPSPPFNAFVSAVAVMPNGDIVVGGGFQFLGPFSSPIPGTSAIARWNGSTWSGIGNGATGTSVNALTVLANGDLLVGGNFTALGGVPCARVGRWNGSVWSPLGAGLPGNGNSVANLLPLPNGDIVAGIAQAQLFGSAGPAVARWDGTSWTPLAPNGFEAANTLTLAPNGDVIAAGRLRQVGEPIRVGVSNVARWDGSSWSALADGANGVTQRLLTTPDGDLLACGAFTRIGTVNANRIARWNGTTWSPLGTGLSSPPGGLTTDVRGVIVRGNGDMIATGNFVLADGAAANRIARWDGSVWSPLGTGLNGDGNALAVLADDTVLVGGAFTSAGGVPCDRIARWDGATFAPLGTMDNVVRSILALPEGGAIVGGDFSTAGGTAAMRIARWDGSAWSALGSGLNGSAFALVQLPGGALVAGGPFTTAGGVPCSRIARWDGTAWSPLGAGCNDTVEALQVLPNGDLIATGRFTSAGGVPCQRIARWDGAAWTPFGTGLEGAGRALAWRPNGEVVVGGEFTTAGGQVAGYLARIGTSCAGTALPLASGCPSSGGNNTLVTEGLPWVGGRLRTTGTGLPSFAFIVAAYGTTPQTPAMPLTSVLPQGQPGCELHVAPEILLLLISDNGTARAELQLPNALAAIGLPFFHQMLPLEVDPNLTPLALTATNALQLTVGAF